MAKKDDKIVRKELKRQVKARKKAGMPLTPVLKKVAKGKL